MLRLCFMSSSIRRRRPSWLVAVAVTSDSHLETKVTLNFPPFVPHSEGTDGLYPPEESITQRQYIPLLPFCQKPFPCPISLHNATYTSSTCNRANGQHMVVFMPGPFPERCHVANVGYLALRSARS